MAKATNLATRSTAKRVARLLDVTERKQLGLPELADLMIAPRPTDVYHHALVTKDGAPVIVDGREVRLQIQKRKRDGEETQYTKLCWHDTVDLLGGRDWRHFATWKGWHDADDADNLREVQMSIVLTPAPDMSQAI
jgi:hypothetical protein